MRRRIPNAQRPSVQRGVVVLVVLSILALIGILLLQVSLNARDELARAQVLVDRAEGTLRIRAAEADLAMALMTLPWQVGDETRSGNPFARVWRFDGQVFAVDGVSLRLQDVNGLFVIPQPGYTAGLAVMPRLLVNLGVNPMRAESTVNRLAKQLEAPVSWPLQDLGELVSSEGLDRREVERLRTVVTAFPRGRFNPATASPSVLAALFSGPVGEALVSLRREGQLNEASANKVLVNVDPELTVFAAGPAVRVTLSVQRGEVSIVRESEWEVAPYEALPIKRGPVRRLGLRESLAR